MARRRFPVRKADPQAQGTAEVKEVLEGSATYNESKEAEHDLINGAQIYAGDLVWCIYKIDTAKVCCWSIVRTAQSSGYEFTIPANEVTRGVIDAIELIENKIE